MTNTLSEIATWHQRARPTPTDANFNVQLGCHFEEILEMMDCLTGADAKADSRLQDVYNYMAALANELKAGSIHVEVTPNNREEFLDALADQVVTAVGVGHCAGMDVTEACLRVNESNWSKFNAEGRPIFNANGKITKGPAYVQPCLAGLF